MNVLVIGGGGREHAIVAALKRSASIGKLLASPGSPGIFELAEKADIKSNDYNDAAEFCLREKIDLVVIGPEQPLADGAADILRDKGVAVFGPSKSAAMLEASKGFAKDFMQRHNVPTANYKQFHKSGQDEAHNFIDCLEIPIVLKADGLAAGKGVIIAETHNEAHDALDEMFDGLFASAGETVVIEEFMYGEEASVFAVCDGEDFITLAPAQDHKRAYDGDKGPNTGGMGAYAPAPIVDADVLKKVKDRIIKPTLKGMKEENNPFVGCLFVGLMIDKGEPKVVEFNARFGDPETEVILPLFKGDFAELLYTAAKGAIDKTKVISTADEYACAVILASKGYPGSIDKGFKICGIDEAKKGGAEVYFSGVAEKDGKLVNNGGRVLAVVGQGDTLQKSIDEAYKACGIIKFDNKFMRSDIGQKGLNFIKEKK
jgi:phosphoribosylamine--glycine ligase